MKRTIAVVALGLAMTVAGWAELTPGQTAPTFTAEASLAGKDFTFSLQKALAKGPVVVYFFPSAFTQGCDLEAHAFATDKDQFTAAGATIIGVSADSIERLNAFSSAPSYCAGKFPVASDPHLKVATEYGLTAGQARPGMKDVRGVAIDHPFISRTTFVVGKDGKVVSTFSSATEHISPEEHVARSLAVVQHLAGK